MATEQETQAMMSAAMAASYAEQMGSQTTPEVVTPLVATPIVAEVVTPLVVTPEVVAPEVVTPEVIPTETVVTPVTKTWEETLFEKSGGKFKSLEDIDLALTPKEVFANEKIKHLNELASKGIDVTSKEFLELQSLDVDKITKVEDVIYEKWKRGEEGKGLSESTIRYEINKKYNVDEWASKEDDEYTLDDKANMEKMARDGQLSKEWLSNYKNERVLEKAVDPKVSEALAEETKQFQNNWEKYVDSDLVNKVAKLSSPISYKDETGKVVESQFSFDVSEQDRAEAGNLMKRLTQDQNAFFNQFRDDKGNQNHEALISMVVKARNYDKAVAMSYTAGAEQRAIAIEKASKNTNFTPAATGGQTQQFATMEEAQADAIRKQNANK